MIVGWQEGKGLLDLTPLEFEAVESVFMVTIKGDKILAI